MNRAFENWMRLVNAIVYTMAGCSADDLPDIAYADLYARGVKPRTAARIAVRNAEAL